MLPSSRYQLKELEAQLQSSAEQPTQPAQRADAETKDFLVFVESELEALFRDARRVLQPHGEAAPAQLQYGKNDLYEDVQRHLSDSTVLTEDDLKGMTPTELSLMDVTVQLERLRLSAPSAGDEKGDAVEKGERSSSRPLSASSPSTGSCG